MRVDSPGYGKTVRVLVLAQLDSKQDHELWIGFFLTTPSSTPLANTCSKGEGSTSLPNWKETEKSPGGPRFCL
ncbi:hypothetical protein CTI12_AA044940 [Artemisia annua]|uniref:Uncharacterized protein n=1 Tax=Artemisia annua TaxID=35608 RepID=A0A2U1QCZ4_ARTAN|nr:hypothetical protein CTI12_AA044940 [Artemisia annua]